MGELVGGALLGLAFTELLDAVKEAISGVKDFEPQLMELERTLQMLHPMILEMERVNTLMNNNELWDQSEVVKRLTSIMEDGKKLVSKCHAISRRRRDFSKKPHYQKKLVELDNNLIRFNIKFMQPNTFLEVQRLRLEQNSGFSRLPDRIAESLRSSNTSLNGITPSSGTTVHGGPIHHSGVHDLDLSYPRTVVPILAAPNRAANITISGLILYVVIILNITAIAVFMYKAIMSMVEKSENELCIVIKDVGMLESTIKQLEDTMTSLDGVLEEIESNTKQVVVMTTNEEEADGGEAAKRLRSLLVEGERLVFESYNIGWWNFVKKWQYQKKMVELDNKLLRFHSPYLQARLAKNSDKTSDDHDSEMKDNESFLPQNSVKGRHEVKGSHMHTREQEPISILKNIVNAIGMSHCRAPPVSSWIGGFQECCALGCCLVASLSFVYFCFLLKSSSNSGSADLARYIFGLVKPSYIFILANTIILGFVLYPSVLNNRKTYVTV